MNNEPTPSIISVLLDWLADIAAAPEPEAPEPDYEPGDDDDEA